MNRKNIILVFLVIALFLSVFIIYMKYNSPYEIDVTTIPSEKTTSSKELVATYINNEKLANTMYKGKVIEVRGIVKEITFFNNKNTVLLHGNIPSSNVLCDMKPNQSSSIKKLKKGQEIKLKGICKGFLKDAILLNCMLINNTNDE